MHQIMQDTQITATITERITARIRVVVMGKVSLLTTLMDMTDGSMRMSRHLMQQPQLQVTAAVIPTLKPLTPVLFPLPLQQMFLHKLSQTVEEIVLQLLTHCMTMDMVQVVSVMD